MNRKLEKRKGLEEGNINTRRHKKDKRHVWRGLKTTRAGGGEDQLG